MFSEKNYRALYVSRYPAAFVFGMLTYRPNTTLLCIWILISVRNIMFFLERKIRPGLRMLDDSCEGEYVMGVIRVSHLDSRPAATHTAQHEHIIHIVYTYESMFWASDSALSPLAETRMSTASTFPPRGSKRMNRITKWNTDAHIQHWKYVSVVVMIIS